MNVTRKRSVLMVTEWERCPLATRLMSSRRKITVGRQRECGEERRGEEVFGYRGKEKKEWARASELIIRSREGIAS